MIVSFGSMKRKDLHLMKSIEIFTEGKQMAAITKAKDRTVLKLSAIVIISTLLLIYGIEVM